MTTQTVGGPTLDLTDAQMPELIGDQPTYAKSSVWARLRLLDPASPVAIYAGILLLLAGFGLLAYTWARVAELLHIGLQMPYLVSGGFTSLALVMTGLLLINISVRRADAAERARESERVVEALRELNERLAKLEG